MAGGGGNAEPGVWDRDVGGGGRENSEATLPADAGRDVDDVVDRGEVAIGVWDRDGVGVSTLGARGGGSDGALPADERAGADIGGGRGGGSFVGSGLGLLSIIFASAFRLRGVSSSSSPSAALGTMSDRASRSLDERASELRPELVLLRAKRFKNRDMAVGAGPAETSSSKKSGALGSIKGGLCGVSAGTGVLDRDGPLLGREAEKLTRGDTIGDVALGEAAFPSAPKVDVVGDEGDFTESSLGTEDARRPQKERRPLRFSGTVEAGFSSCFSRILHPAGTTSCTTSLLALMEASQAELRVPEIKCERGPCRATEVCRVAFTAVDTDLARPVSRNLIADGKGASGRIISCAFVL